MSIYDFKKIEENARKFWNKNKVIEKTIEYNPKKKLFSFLEGPPTANGKPGIHHTECRVYKDLVCRYYYMKGFTVPRKGGWDCHGLPVEVQIEKKMGFKTKKDVLNFGIANFNNECKKSVFEFVEFWNDLTEKLAYWVDLKEPYITMDNKYIESVWWSLKELHNKKMLYEAHKVVPFCPRCETPLSSHEVAQGYETVKETAIVVKFKLKNYKNRFVLAWTTTPWTLPSNLALAVNKKFIYSIIKSNEEEYIILRDLKNKYFKDAETIEEIKGEKLIGLEYEPIFHHFIGKLNKPSWKVLHADFVSIEEGTGIVHIAPAFGEDDYNLCKENDFAFIQPVGEDGKFTKEIPEYEGRFVKQCDKDIIEDLESKNIAIRKETIEHEYPFCWRCKTPLLYFAMKSWFINVSSIKDKLVKNNENIFWAPEFIKEGRFGNWIAGAKDWALSRKKFWGTPLPIWKCICGNIEAIGSIAELKSKAVNFPKNLELHKPMIDEIKLKCPKCKKEMQRVEDVIDCWYDSGAAPFAQLHYPFENVEYFKKRHPYDFIAEALDQTRGWFYTLHVLSTILFNKPAFKSVICAGLLLDDKGFKMSKSKGNIIDPFVMFDKVGVDAVRMQMCAGHPGDSKRFGENSIKEVVNPFLNIAWNVYTFTLQSKNKKPAKNYIEDKWLISRTNSMIKTVEKNLKKYELQKSFQELVNFMNEDVSRWYIKIIRDRDDYGAVLRYTLKKFALVLAPFAPHLAEELWLNIGSKKSVHESSWPVPEKISKELESRMNIVKELVQTVLAMRETARIGLRWPIKDITIYSKDKEIQAVISSFKNVIKKQVNVKGILTKAKGEGKSFHEKALVSINTELDEELMLEGYAREISRRVQAERKNVGMKMEDKIEIVIKSDVDLSKMKEYLKEKVGAKKVDIGIPKKEYKNKSSAEIKGHIFEYYFE